MNHSHLSELKKNAQKIIQKDKQTHDEALIQKMNTSLKDLEVKLQECTKNAVITIESDMQSLKNSSKLLTKSSMKIFIFNLLLSMSLILGLFMGSLGIAKYLSTKIQNMQKEINILSEEIVKKEKLLAGLNTLGIEIVERHNQKGEIEQFIILPQGLNAVLGYTTDSLSGNVNAIKLTRE